MPPSAFHEILVSFFRDRPALAPELLGPLLGDALPAGSLRVSDANFTQIAPAAFAADLVIMVGDPPELGIIVEVQLGRDDLKRYSWPLYACALRARLRCPAVVLVLAPDPGVAAWAAQAIETGPGGSTFKPQVVGPDAIPKITSWEAARAAPELAVLSALAHGDGEQGERVLLAMLEGLGVLQDDTAKLYYDLVWSRLTGPMQQALEEAMNKFGYEYQSDFARKYMAQGMAEGMAEGIAKGEAQEACRLVLRQLARRFGLLGQELHGSVEALEIANLEALSEALLDFESIAQLEAWVAASATT